MRVQIRRSMRETATADAAPARTVRSRAPGRLRDPSWGYYGPCARCSLTARVHRRDTQARTGAEPEPKGAGESRSRAPRGERPGVPGRISGDPEIGVTARHATG